ncbi:hypothetical protein Gpo141_00006120 [Globisporangium polare]
MTKFPLPPDTFPRLVLPQKDADEIEALSTMLVQKTLAQYHEHAVVSHEAVDELRWKKVRQKDDIRVYKERSLKKQRSLSSSASSNRSTNNSGDGSLTSMLQGRSTELTGYGDSVPVLMGVGTIKGDLDDVMFGVLNPTTEAMRVKSTYADEGFLDGSVLATLVQPTREDPLRSLTLRWCVKRNPLIMTPVVRMRDVVYIESTGVAYIKSGERIGYQLFHSVELPGVRELTSEYQLVRANVSICFLYRQKTPDTVDVFMRGVLNPLGDVRPGVSVISTAEALVSVATNIHVAQMKKLMWLLRTVKSVPSLAAPDGSSSNEDASHCRVCLQSLSSSFALLASLKRRSSCAACLEPICAKCSVVKKLSFVSPRSSRGDAVSQAKFTFCSRCVTRALEASTVAVALDELDDPRATFVDDYFFLLRGVADDGTPPTSFSSNASR